MKRYGKRLGAVLLGLLFALGFGGAPASASPEQDHAAPLCVPRSECCKVCSAGQACGDSCISRDKECHKGPGCACDADEVCR